MAIAMGAMRAMATDMATDITAMSTGATKSTLALRLLLKLLNDDHIKLI